MDYKISYMQSAKNTLTTLCCFFCLLREKQGKQESSPGLKP